MLLSLTPESALSRISDHVPYFRPHRATSLNHRLWAGVRLAGQRIKTLTAYLIQKQNTSQKGLNEEVFLVSCITASASYAVNKSE